MANGEDAQEYPREGDGDPARPVVPRPLVGPTEFDKLVVREFQELSKSVEAANRKIEESKRKRWAWGFKTTV